MSQAHRSIAREAETRLLPEMAWAPARRKAIAARLDTSVPVLILGGKENALSVTRHLGSLGITVRVSGGPNCWGMHSRFCAQAFPVPFGASASDFWAKLLLQSAMPLKGHILLACSDDAIEFLVAHHAELERHYRLDDARPELQTALLDKKRTLELARDAGVPTPQFWTIASEADIATVMASARLPLMVKPIHSHRFTRIFGRKLFIIDKSLDELAEKIRLARSHDLEVMVVEMIPGPDDRLSSYYTYMDETGRNLFHFTKRILRRYPVNRGNACYHITGWMPETAALGRKFFDAIGFRGFGNIEFKRDHRDGLLKVIECNARFTAAQELLLRAGAPVDLIVYCHLTGQPLPHFDSFSEGLRFWYPQRDFLAFLELRKRGELTLAGWIKSILSHRQVLPLLALNDPLPSFWGAYAMTCQLLRGRG